MSAAATAVTMPAAPTTTSVIRTSSSAAAAAAETTTATTTSSISIADCRKFSPNIFNKSKCSHCFRQREEHSAAALECNRASRKVSKCGYLFVAPDWDFSNPLYRTKRWQRRWFVLYDDGELTYSVDEHPETVPQACIDMTKVLEVTTAEDVTGHTNSIAITAPDRVTFVKGTCHEESKWWLNTLASFPKSKGRHKRNATFPGGQATTILQNNLSDTCSATTSLSSVAMAATAATATPLSSSPSAAATTIGAGATTTSTILSIRNRHNSYHKDALTSALMAGGGGVLIGESKSVKDVWQCGDRNSRVGGVNDQDDDEDDDDDEEDECDGDDDDDDDDDDADDGVETGEDDEDEEEQQQMQDEIDLKNARQLQVAKLKQSKHGKIMMVAGGNSNDCNAKVTTSTGVGGSGGQDENNRNAGNEINNRVSSPAQCLLIEDIRRDEKTIKDIANTITNLSQQQSKRCWSTTTAVNNVLNSHMQQQKHQQHQHDDKNSSRDEIDFHRTTATAAAATTTAGATTTSPLKQQTTTLVNLRPKSLPLASNSTPAIVSAIVKKIPPVVSLAVTASSSSALNKSNCKNDGSSINSNNTNNKCKSSPRLQMQLKHLQQKHQNNQQQQQRQQQQQHKKQQQQQVNERGDPDGGCNLDDLSTNYLAKTAELRVSNCATSTPIAGKVNAEQQPPEESLNAKKGWLLKQDNRTGDWTKHWFTLSGAALFYYRDPVSEERGVLDGVLDVNSLTNVAEVNANKNYGFQLTTWDKRRLILASLSPNSRNSWTAVLRNAAGLKSLQPNLSSTSCTSSPIKSDSTIAPIDPLSSNELIVKDNTSDDIKSEIEKDFIKAQRNHDLLLQNYQQPQLEDNKNTIINSGSTKFSTKILSDASPQVIITNASNSSSSSNSSCSAAPKPSTATVSIHSPVQTPSTPKPAVIAAAHTTTTTITTHFSSDEEYRTASEGGRRDSIDWGSPLSPSPPIPLSLLRAKDRGGTSMSSRSNVVYPRLHKRSRSSPPSSRRSTVDSVGSDDLPPILPVQEEQLNIDKELQFRLDVVEKERNMLRDEADDREARMTELLTTLERTEQELTLRIQEMEEVRENLTAQLDEAKRSAEEIIDRLTDELEESQKKVKDLEDRLARGIDENETLYKRLRELESCSPSSFSTLNRSKLKRMDSLSDLTQISDIDPYCQERDSLADEYTELRSRFEKAVNEIRAMKRELKDSQNQFDSLEISYASLKQDLERKELEDRAQLQMMAERIQDLTLKYSSSERQVRTLKQKLAKSARRRSLSLKGKEQLTVSKEIELKVTELETKIDEMEKATREKKSPSPIYAETSANVKNSATSRKSSRRRSLESSASTDSIQFMVRVNDLEKRFEGVSGSRSSISSSSTPTPIPGTPTPEGSAISNPKISEHLIERLRCLEGVLIASKDRLEQSLQQLHNLRSSRTRRSVSPITDRKDSYRYVERCLGEVVKLLRESCETCIISGSCNTPSVMLPDTNPVKVALNQLEIQLRNKLADLLKQRRVLRERNELTKRKDLELLAERVAFESVCFGKLRDSVTRAENPELFGQRQTRAEVAETSHLMTMLKAKLSGKCALKPSGSLDILAGVLARRLVLSTYRKQTSGSAKTALEPVDQNILDDLLRQQNEICAIAKRYKNNAMENLATGLAAETLSYISSNDLVHGAVQEAWRQAQETVNAELVQSEIAHIMMRNAERFENSLTPAFGYTLTPEERLSFEKFADAVHDALRKEMELAVSQLSHCYEDALQKMKRGQWRMQLEQERKASEGRQLLAEFADIIAHKALVDARIAVLCGEYVDANATCTSTASTQQPQSQQQCESNKMGITALQKYEHLFEELSNDLQINNPDDILAEADFEFMYKQHTIDFFNDRQVLSDISTFLGQLEDSLIALQCEAASTTSIPRSAISIENLQDVCHKCCELRQRADYLLQEVHRKLNTPCQHCLQVREKLCDLKQQHDNEVVCLKQSHTKDLSALMQQVENQRNALRSLETEKNAINGDLHRSEQLIEVHERDLKAMSIELKTKDERLRTKEADQQELLQRLDEQSAKVRALHEESEVLTVKCARQDEEYAVLLQERDYLQAELNKERERSRRFEKRLELLELEHGKQLECLQDAYRDQLLSHCSDFSNVADEESFRQRYQTEIEQLRTLCEKGLSAMESSHRRIISDLEKKHRQEIDRLLLEKETALAEETQATLAALDAMRKAHQSEVQREVARFKQEFLKQFQKGEPTPQDTVKTKEEELEELRQEILSFSEKYSIKCVENAALEEKLRSANQKLKHFQQMQQLELRNKQFRAHLASEDPSSDVNFVQGLNTTKDETICQDSESKTTHTHVELRDTTLQEANKITNTNDTITTNSTTTTNSTKSLISSNSNEVINNIITTTTTTTTKQNNDNENRMIINESSSNNNNSIINDLVVISQPSNEFDSPRSPTPQNDGHDDVIGNASTNNCNQNDNNHQDGDDKGNNSRDNDNVDHGNSDRHFSYKPCYKESNLYYYQNMTRTCFEGLKSSTTFGKNLKTTLTIAPPASPASKTPTIVGTTILKNSNKSSIPSTVSTTAATTPPTVRTTLANVIAKESFLQQVTSPASSTSSSSSPSRSLFNLQLDCSKMRQKHQQHIYKTATTINFSNYFHQNINNSNNQQQEETPSIIDLQLTSTPTPTKPVEQPKNFSANNHINYININNNNNRYNHNNNNHHNFNYHINYKQKQQHQQQKLINNIQKEQELQQQQSQQQIRHQRHINHNYYNQYLIHESLNNNSNNNNNNNNNHSNSITTPIATTRTKNLQIAERTTAINLESFNDILLKTKGATTTTTKCFAPETSAMKILTTNDDVGDVQQQQQPIISNPYNNKNSNNNNKSWITTRYGNTNANSSNYNYTTTTFTTEITTTTTTIPSTVKQDIAMKRYDASYNNNNNNNNNNVTTTDTSTSTTSSNFYQTNMLPSSSLYCHVATQTTTPTTTTITHCSPPPLIGRDVEQLHASAATEAATLTIITSALHHTSKRSSDQAIIDTIKINDHHDVNDNNDVNDVNGNIIIGSHPKSCTNRNESVSSNSPRAIGSSSSRSSSSSSCSTRETSIRTSSNIINSCGSSSSTSGNADSTSSSINTSNSSSVHKSITTKTPIKRFELEI